MPPVTQEFELDIVDLSHDGRGVGRLDGKAIFVTGALAGERVRVRFTRRKRKFDQAELVEVLSASPDRVTPRCPHFGLCGGCALQHLDPMAQIAAKQRILLENLERIGQVVPARVLDPLTGPVWGYRRKARLGVKYVRPKERVLVGFREAADPRFIADIQRCEVLVPAVGERIADLAALVAGLDARERIAQIEVAAGDDGAVLVFRHLDPLGEADRDRLVAFGQRHRLGIFLQPGGNDSVHPLWPENPSLSFELPQAQARLAFRPLDFVQVNAELNLKMIDHALALLDPQPDERVLDLFCGLGNFTLPLARRAAEVVGVEGEAGLVQRARDNAAGNGIGNVRFHAADLSKPLAGEPWLHEDYQRILLDPPRTGADALIAQLPTRRVRRIVYVSCHPGSLARDAGLLVREHGFRLSAAGAMDMFPHTAHVESIAVFDRG
ncbi:MAG: 23S rRNA (uracil(1939)-C(5))-methyltransferase RlmD [Lysobacteraceae bacterium]